jgi:hypothetical protein
LIVQLDGGVTAVQVKLMMLEEVAVAVNPVGAEGSVVQIAESPSISMPLTMG